MNKFKSVLNIKLCQIYYNCLICLRHKSRKTFPQLSRIFFTYGNLAIRSYSIMPSQNYLYLNNDLFTMVTIVKVLLEKNNFNCRILSEKNMAYSVAFLLCPTPGLQAWWRAFQTKPPPPSFCPQPLPHGCLRTGAGEREKRGLACAFKVLDNNGGYFRFLRWPQDWGGFLCPSSHCFSYQIHLT